MVFLAGKEMFPPSKTCFTHARPGRARAAHPAFARPTARRSKPTGRGKASATQVGSSWTESPRGTHAEKQLGAKVSRRWWPALFARPARIAGRSGDLWGAGIARGSNKGSLTRLALLHGLQSVFGRENKTWEGTCPRTDEGGEGTMGVHRRTIEAEASTEAAPMEEAGTMVAALEEAGEGTETGVGMVTGEDTEIEVATATGEDMGAAEEDTVTGADTVEIGADTVEIGAVTETGVVTVEIGAVTATGEDTEIEVATATGADMVAGVVKVESPAAMAIGDPQ